MSYNAAKIVNYTRINPHTGTGFILARLNTRDMTKREVYEGTHYGHWTPGYHSSIWAKLLEDGLIMPYNGFVDVKIPGSFFNHSNSRNIVRAKGCGIGKNYTVLYFITELGRKILTDMNARFGSE